MNDFLLQIKDSPKGGGWLNEPRAKKRWSAKEEQIIKNNYKKLSDKELKESFFPHRSRSAIQGRRCSLGCLKQIQSPPIWTSRELELLYKHWKDYDQRELQEKFFPNKTVEQVRSAKMMRGLKKPPVWTNDERGILLDHGANYSSGDLKKMFFPNKTKNQIGWMRKHLGVYRGKD
jgi:hypothetical protein